LVFSLHLAIIGTPGTTTSVDLSSASDLIHEGDNHKPKEKQQPHE